MPSFLYFIYQNNELIKKNGYEIIDIKYYK